MTQKNVLFFLVDALRYDIVADASLRRALMPNFDWFVTRGYLGKVIANAGTTQFVLPSLMAQRYPLDDGGYDIGIRQSAKTFTELFREAGYSTYLATSLDQFCMAHDFERGFDEVRGLFSFSATLKRLITRKLSHEISLWRAGEHDNEAIVEVVREELGRLLLKFVGITVKPFQFELGLWRAHLHNSWIARMSSKELCLLDKNPQTVLKKLECIEPFYYWTALGKTSGGWRQKWVRLISAMVAVSRRFLIWLPFVFPQYASFQYSANQVVGDLPNRLNSDERPWLAYIHVMDVHSYRIYRGLYDLLTKVILLPRLFRLRRDNRSNRPVMHDLALMRVDRVFGRIIKSLRQNGELERTVIIMTGDHGQYFPDHGPRQLQDIHFRTYREHLEVPLVVYGPEKLPEQCDGMLDSMSISATLLEAVNLRSHPSFKGVSAYAGGKPVVIAENAGRGSADIARKDLYFNITGYNHSMKVVLRGRSLEVIALYDHFKDSLELNDVSKQKDKQNMVKIFLRALKSERGELLEHRDALNLVSLANESEIP